jgi:predicted AlkP superfamily phosphohydrolase/phosphomutase
MTYRKFAVAFAAALIFALSGCTRITEVKPAHRVVVLGFDGADPGLVERWLDHLPNIRRLQQTGTVEALTTTEPPESPVAWAAFATGSNPGKTGIYDFLTRDPKTYMPRIGLITRVPGRFLWGIPLRAPRLINNRHGVPFYRTVAQAGIRTAVIRMPLAFPASPLPNGELLAGLGVPDLRGTWGTFYYFSTALSQYDTGDTEFGGKLVRLDFGNGRSLTTTLEGPPDPTSAIPARLTTPLGIEILSQPPRVRVTLAGESQTMGEHRWSGWMRMTFRAGPFIKLHGITRFYLEQASPDVRLYMTPMSFNPDNEDVPITAPREFGGRLSRIDGFHKSLGWWDDTWALNEGRIDDGVFLQDLDNNMSTEERMMLDVLDHDQPDLMVCVYTDTDSVSHMFYRLLDPQHPMYDPALAAKYGDAILNVYEHMDRIVGEAMARLRPGDTLLVVSDHGFHTWRRGFNTNTWLVANGYLVMKNQGTREPAKRLDDLYDRGSFFPNVDWSRTRAYALGLGQIYLNLQGRERDGIVPPAAAENLRREIRARLLAYRDPDNGLAPICKVLFPRRIYHGGQLSDAADLQLAFNDGYRTSWQTALGAAPPGIVVINQSKWSGDHCASDPSQTKGVFFCNRHVTGAPDITDIGPTVLRLMNLPADKRMDGRAVTFVR